MSALSGKLIRDRLATDDLAKRLVISPLLEPGEQLRDDQASIDIRLGFEFAFAAPSSHGAIDEFGVGLDQHQPASFQTLYRREYVPLGKRLVIHPHQFILAATLEYIRLPQDIMGYVLSRSTWGRIGLIVATAVGIQPGFAGSLTLEIRNLGESPVALYPGQAIAQLVFHEISGGKVSGDGLGQYSGMTEILPRKMSATRTREKLQKLTKLG